MHFLLKMHIDPLLHLRIYPLQFAEAVAGIFDELVATRMGCPEVSPDAQETFLDLLGMDEPAEVADLFTCADFGNVYDYLRGGKNLRLPPEYRFYFPVRVPDA